MKQRMEMKELSEDVYIPAGQVDLEGALDLPAGCCRVVVFAHGSGSSRFSPRNRFVAKGLSDRRIGTLLLDLLTPEEDSVYRTVRCPTLLIVGGHDPDVLKLNQDAFRKLTCEKQLAVVPGATHLFEEAGKLEEVARLAGNWFEHYL
jgi:hypothetical protein